MGGHSDLPLFEDVAIAKALRGRLVRLRARAISDPRRYLEEGWLSRGAQNLLLLAKYCMGTPPEQLAESYYRRNPTPEKSTA